MPRPWSYGRDVCLLQGELLEPPCFDSLEDDHEETEEQEDVTLSQPAAVSVRQETGNQQVSQEQACFKHKKANAVK